MIEVAGAPADQGRAQGEALRGPVRGAVAALRRRQGGFAFRAACGRAQRGPARALARFLPWQAERVEGIALAAGVAARALFLGERVFRVRGVAGACASRLQASLDIPPELAGLVLLRASIPDAGGFASLELTCAGWASCLGGINSEGLAVLCADDRTRSEPSLRFLAQEFLFRARDLDAGVEHLRRRARYAGGTGTLLVAAPGAAARRLCFEDGALAATPAADEPLPARYTLAIDCGSRQLCFDPGTGPPLAGRPPATPEVRS